MIQPASKYRKTMQKLFNKTKGKDKSRGCKSDHCLFVEIFGLCLEILFSETSTNTFSEDDLLEKINEDCNKLLRFGRDVITKIRKEVVIKNQIFLENSEDIMNQVGNLEIFLLLQLHGTFYDHYLYFAYF